MFEIQQGDEIYKKKYFASNIRRLSRGRGYLCNLMSQIGQIVQNTPQMPVDSKPVQVEQKGKVNNNFQYFRQKYWEGWFCHFENLLPQPNKILQNLQIKKKKAAKNAFLVEEFKK